MLETYTFGERRACRVLSVNRTAYRYEPVKRDDEDEVRADIIDKACNFGRVVYRQVGDMMRNEGRKINHKRVERIWRNNAVIEVLSELMIIHDCPEYLRSDNGSEFTVKKFRKWLQNIGVITTYIKPGSPWENGYCESFNARMRDEFLNGEIFGNIFEVEVWTKRWIEYYNTIRPHSSLGGRPPAPQTFVPRTA